jgi:Lrp/AsnC family transcriptional regulator, leucine-responsive regulatory protein
MTAEGATSLEALDWAVIAELQREGRLPFEELARRVNLDVSAVTERVRRLETRGFITGYHASVDLAKLGSPVLALIRLDQVATHRRALDRLLAERREVLECLWSAGEGCFFLKVTASSMYHLDALVASVSQLGPATTTVISTTVLAGRGIDAPFRPA